MADFFELYTDWFCSTVDHQLFSDKYYSVQKYLSENPDQINKTHYITQTKFYHRNHSENYITPIMYACRYGNCDVFDLLIEKGAYINVLDDYDYTLLHHVLDFYMPNNPHIINKLISFDMDSIGLQKNVEGYSPLHCYLKTAKIEMGTILSLIPISDPNSQNNYGENCLMTLCNSSVQTDIIKLFIDLTKDINLQDMDGNNVLHFAKNQEIASLLIKNGADPNVRNNYGSYPRFRI